MDRLLAIRLIRSANIGPRGYFAQLEKYGSVEAALVALGNKAYPVSEAENEIKLCAQLGFEILLHSDAQYPEALLKTYDAPPVLFYLGELALLEKKIIGIVGTRNASACGCVMARKIAGELGEAEAVVASGLARGIDTEAHKASLASGTVAVVAGGLDMIYPPENKKLFHEIAEKGLVLSENPPGVRALARHFPQRNRIIAGISAGLLVVEAARKSGSMITADYARREGRPVFAVPGSPLDERANGTNFLLKNGAVLAENALDILDNLHEMPKLPRLCENEEEYEYEELAADISGLHELVIAKLSHTPVSVDEVIQQLEVPAGQVNEVLLELEMAGKAQRQRGNKVSLAA